MSKFSLTKLTLIQGDFRSLKKKIKYLRRPLESGTQRFLCRKFVFVLTMFLKIASKQLSISVDTVSCERVNLHAGILEEKVEKNR